MIANQYIPKPLEDTCFRTPEHFIFKTAHFFNGYSGEYAPAFSKKLHPCSALKNKGNEEYELLRRPYKVGLETLYPALLISIRE
ncbi:hypothetical protein CXF79_09995 [Colwellia sp. Bg11-28]|nr:hypothetical protein CXF79_09995 [Colwellia sp. Bg11-28]